MIYASVLISFVSACLLGWIAILLRNLTVQATAAAVQVEDVKETLNQHQINQAVLDSVAAGKVEAVKDTLNQQQINDAEVAIGKGHYMPLVPPHTDAH